eukprot:SM000193S05191  [mRNA]  locus=s193:230296:233816:- [translate_table: standard]
MSRWSVAELTLGLYKLAHRHYQKGVKDTIPGEPINYCEVDKEHILRHSIKSQIQRPAFFVALDHERELVVLRIRGTYAATNVLTDLTPPFETANGGRSPPVSLEDCRTFVYSTWTSENFANLVTHAQDDVVARASASALENLPSEIIETNWMELALGYEKGHLYQKMAQLGGMYELSARIEEVKAGDHGEKAEAAVQWLSTGAVIVKGDLERRLVLIVMCETAVALDICTSNQYVLTIPRYMHSSVLGPAEATYTASGTSDIITAPPLVVPGLLYHVVRQTLQAGEVPPLTIDDLTGEEAQGNNGGAGSLRVREVVLWLQAEQEDEREAALQHKSSRSWWAWGGNSSKNSSSKKVDEAVDAAMKPGGSCKRAKEDLLAETVVNGAHREGVDAATIVKPGTRASQADKGESSSWWASLTRKKVEDEPGVAGAGAFTLKTDGNGKEVTEEVHEKGAERKVEAVSVRHVVIQGTDPNCRFKRIVLSNTMLSDHGCYSCRDGPLDALRWTA